MARKTGAHEHFGLMYLPGGQSDPVRQAREAHEEAMKKLPKTSKSISPAAAHAQTSNATNRGRQLTKEAKK